MLKREQVADATPPNLPEAVSRETLERLKAYVILVQKWTKSINLVARADRDAIWARHILDSARLVPLIPKGAVSGIDLGSGAGFPGLILSLLLDMPFDLVEVDQRKAAFLQEAQRVTGASVKVHCARIEEVCIPRTSLITARALAPLEILLAYTSRLLLPSGTALFPKGAQVRQEIIQAERHWRMQIVQYVNPKQPDSAILSITNLVHV